MGDQELIDFNAITQLCNDYTEVKNIRRDDGRLEIIMRSKIKYYDDEVLTDILYSIIVVKYVKEKCYVDGLNKRIFNMATAETLLNIQDIEQELNFVILPDGRCWVDTHHKPIDAYCSPYGDLACCPIISALKSHNYAQALDNMVARVKSFAIADFALLMNLVEWFHKTKKGEMI